MIPSPPLPRRASSTPTPKGSPSPRWASPMPSPRTPGGRLITPRMCASFTSTAAGTGCVRCRRLEAEAARNLEVVWLLRGVRPDFKTIADFRKDNKACFKGVLREFNLLCRQLELFGAELVAIDGAKFKAVNSPKRHYSAEQLQVLV